MVPRYCTIGAEKDTIQEAGVAPQSENYEYQPYTINYSKYFRRTSKILQRVTGINWAYKNENNIINNSWGDQGGQFFDQLHSTLLEDAMYNVLLNNG